MYELKEHPRLQANVLPGECLKVLKEFQDSSINLVVTSPPYADQRASTYGAHKPEEYVEWFLPIADELYRALKPTGLNAFLTVLRL